MRIIGEPIWPGRSESEYSACVQHEALINLALTGRAATILCPYDTAGLDERTLTDARATHPTLLDTDGRRLSSEFDPRRIMADYNQPLPVPAASAEFTVDVTNVSAARRFVTTHASRLGLPEHRLADLELAVTELVENSITHGGGSGALRVWAEDGHLLCEVSDAGMLTDPLAGRRPADQQQLGGRGLLLVNVLADLVRVYTGRTGTVVRIFVCLG